MISFCRNIKLRSKPFLSYMRRYRPVSVIRQPKSAHKSKNTSSVSDNAFMANCTVSSKTTAARKSFLVSNTTLLGSAS